MPRKNNGEMSASQRRRAEQHWRWLELHPDPFERACAQYQYVSMLIAARGETPQQRHERQQRKKEAREEKKQLKNLQALAKSWWQQAKRGAAAELLPKIEIEITSLGDLCK